MHGRSFCRCSRQLVFRPQPRLVRELRRGRGHHPARGVYSHAVPWFAESRACLRGHGYRRGRRAVLLRLRQRGGARHRRPELPRLCPVRRSPRRGGGERGGLRVPSVGGGELLHGGRGARGAQGRCHRGQGAQRGLWRGPAALAGRRWEGVHRHRVPSRRHARVRRRAGRADQPAALPVAHRERAQLYAHRDRASRGGYLDARHPARVRQRRGHDRVPGRLRSGQPLRAGRLPERALSRRRGGGRQCDAPVPHA